MKIIFIKLCLFLSFCTSANTINFEFIDTVIHINRNSNLFKTRFRITNSTPNAILIKNFNLLISNVSFDSIRYLVHFKKLPNFFMYTLSSSNDMDSILLTSIINEHNFPICLDYTTLLHYRSHYYKIIDKKGKLLLKKKKYFKKPERKINSFTIGGNQILVGIFYFPIDATDLKPGVYYIQTYYKNTEDVGVKGIFTGFHKLPRIKLIIDP